MTRCHLSMKLPSVVQQRVITLPLRLGITLFHLLLRVLFITCMQYTIFYVEHLLDDAHFLSVHKNHVAADLSYHFATLLAPRIIY